MHTKDFQGLKIYRIPSESKRSRKDGTPRDPKRLGKIHFPVFSAKGTHLVGFMVSPPDIAGMVKQPDKFVPRDAIRVYEGVVAIDDVRENYDAAAAKRLGIDLDTCIIWTGMDVVTTSGKKLGYCTDVEFNGKTGAAKTFTFTPGAASSALLGTLEMPASYLRGYADGAMIVSDEAASLEFSGGAAAKAGEASAKIKVKAQQGAETLDEKGAEAIEKGSVVVGKGARALGKQLGRTRGMFSSFKDEFKKAAGSAPSKKGKKK